MFNPSVVAQCTLILYWLLALMYCMVVNVIKGTENLKPSLLGSRWNLNCSDIEGLTNPLNAKLNPICHLLALLGAHHILHVSRIWVNYRINRSHTLAHDTLFLHRPKYRYPYYDENGRGKLLYGYGGQELYQYKAYSPLEGIH